ncbi:hypothetical protein E4V01_15915 [Methylorubrum sp. Q1]|uniref:TnsA endonuclease N-terminal domain-containing protein n=1 Tax=Methylorubrum sp. Q1 TaxID=2562453 RepID=UPI001076981E|nr:TnsA endonuclease N-terminal domain-containing protein [Methylorubrum sp. Q1]TFZ57123.1 hypothetical protein E4V01_15915 [Methylorubrum sp. Q1]
MSTIPATFASDEPAHRWREPSRSVATRRYAQTPQWSGRSFIVEPNDNREILTESELEAKAALILLARPDCARLFEQPAPVPYRDHEGVRRTHTFDFLLMLKSGRRIAVAVKPKAIADKHGTKALITLIARQMEPAFADGALLMTDAMMPRADVQNGRLIHDARRLPDPELDARVRGVAEELNGASTIACIVRTAGLEHHDQGFSAVARAIGDGILVPTRRGLIDLDMMVRRAVPGGPP